MGSFLNALGFMLSALGDNHTEATGVGERRAEATSGAEHGPDDLGHQPNEYGTVGRSTI